MNLNDLLRKQDIDPRLVILLRHKPPEPTIRRTLPWLAAEKHDIFNTYQQTQTKRLEQAMEKLTGHGYIASFIAQETGSAVFAGLYAIKSSKPITNEQLFRKPAYKELISMGMFRWPNTKKTRSSFQWFDLVLTDFYKKWKGRLVVEWPTQGRAWWRRAHRSEFPIHAVLEESCFVGRMPNWQEIEFRWEELALLPKRWQTAISQWRGIYYIFDRSDGRGYVGSAYGENNLLGRWRNYAAKGDGGNKLLRKRDPHNFVFTILQRVSPDMDAQDVIQVENSWKQRLHTRAPDGLNEN
ncbi:MAG: GIY-YIG nuclease family protein [Candidatus Hydrogenedentales bacterium]